MFETAPLISRRDTIDHDVNGTLLEPQTGSRGVVVLICVGGSVRMLPQQPHNHLLLPLLLLLRTTTKCCGRRAAAATLVSETTAAAAGHKEEEKVTNSYEIGVLKKGHKGQEPKTLGFTSRRQKPV